MYNSHSVLFIHSNSLTPFLVPAFLPELHGSERRRWRRRSRERQRERRGRRGLRDPADHSTQPPGALPPPPDGARLHRVPLPLVAPQRAHQPLLLPGAARPHDVQHAGPGRTPALQPDALGEWLSKGNTVYTQHCI